MIILKGIADRLTAVIQVAQATNPVSIVTGWRTMSPEKHLPDGNGFNISDNTPVIIVPVSLAKEQKAVEYIRVSNNDTVAHIINISRVSGPTSVPIISSVVLAAGESMEYNDRDGFRTFANNGALKQVYQNGTSPIGTNVQMLVLANPVTNNNAVANTMQDVPGLQFAVVAGQRYRFKFVVNYSAQATTTGSRWSINGPGSPTDLNYDSDYSLTGTTRTINTGQSAYDLPAASNVTSSSTTSNLAIVEGFITPSANGIVTLRFASEVAGSGITAKAGSYVEFQQV